MKIKATNLQEKVEIVDQDNQPIATFRFLGVGKTMFFNVDITPDRAGLVMINAWALGERILHREENTPVTVSVSMYSVEEPDDPDPAPTA